MGAPVTIGRLKQELESLKAELDAGKLKHTEYDQRLTRIIHELRDNKMDADRAGLVAMLNDVLGRGVITPSVKAHLENRLGLK
jgi:hypothetical protein